MSRRGNDSHYTADTAGPLPRGLAVQHPEKWSAASHLLSPSVLDRLCGKDSPNHARRIQLDQSHVIVATYYDEPIGFAAYKAGTAAVRVAHELWVDAHAPCELAPVVTMLLGQLELEALKSGCSKLFIIVPQTTPLRPILQTHGYAITLEGDDLLWFEKAFHQEPERVG